MPGERQRADITRIQDQLIELYVEREEAAKAKNSRRVRELQTEIDQMKSELEETRETAGTA